MRERPFLVDGEKPPGEPFVTPHQRNRYELIQNLTDDRTAAQIHALVSEGYIANYETALKSAISNLYREKTTHDDPSYRYYCPDCEFIGGVSTTPTVAEYSSRKHDSFREECDSFVFEYESDEWDAENVEEIAERGRLNDE